MAHGPQKAATLITLSAFALIGGMRGTARAFTFQCTNPLIFGTLVNCPGGGSVTVSPAGMASAGGCITIPPANTAQKASCQVVNDTIPAVLEVSIPGAPVVLNNGTGATITVDNFLMQTSGGSPAASITISGIITVFDIGATLTISAGKPGGQYSGVFSVTVDYQ